MGCTIAHSVSVRSLGLRKPLRSATRRCSGFHIGGSPENQAPNKESHPIHQTQELPGSALSRASKRPREHFFKSRRLLCHHVAPRLVNRTAEHEAVALFCRPRISSNVSWIIAGWQIDRNVKRLERQSIEPCSLEN